MISSDEALLLLNKWHQEKHPLRLVFAAEGLRMAFDGLIENMQGSKLQFSPHEPNSCAGESFIDVVDCRFEYGDSREAEHGSMPALKYSSVLTVIRRDGGVLILAELRL